MKDRKLRCRMENYEELLRLIGKEQTEKICKRFGGSVLYIPSEQSLEKLRQREEIISDIKAGVDIKTVAKKYGWSVNGVRQLSIRVLRKK